MFSNLLVYPWSQDRIEPRKLKRAWRYSKNTNIILPVIEKCVLVFQDLKIFNFSRETKIPHMIISCKSWIIYYFLPHSLTFILYHYYLYILLSCSFHFYLLNKLKSSNLVNGTHNFNILEQTQTHSQQELRLAFQDHNISNNKTKNPQRNRAEKQKPTKELSWKTKTHLDLGIKTLSFPPVNCPETERKSVGYRNWRNEIEERVKR